MAINTTNTMRPPHSIFNMWKKFRNTKSRRSVVKRREFFKLTKKILCLLSSLYRSRAIPAKIMEKSVKKATVARRAKTEMFNTLYPPVVSKGRKF